jgi:hypothetical protein
VLHFNVLLRDADLSPSDVQRWAVGAGFGEVVYASPARTSVGLGRYVAGYITKARDVFPPGFRVVRCSRGWSLARTPEGGEVPAPSGDERKVVLEATGAGLPTEPPGWYAYPVTPERRLEGLIRRRWRALVGRREFDERCAGMFQRRAAARGWA